MTRRELTAAEVKRNLDAGYTKIADDAALKKAHEEFRRQVFDPLIDRTFKILDEMGIIDEIMYDQLLQGYAIINEAETAAAVEDALNEWHILKSAATPKPVMLDCWKIR